MGTGGPPVTVWSVLRDLARHPVTHLIRRWNWKSALMSALIRAAIFFGANLSAGMKEAAGAMAAEFAFRIMTSGFYGSITQAFRRSEPAWVATLVAMVLLPLFSHSLEFGIHFLRGTPNLARSIAASVTFTAISAMFNLYAMRRGVLIVGEDRKSLWADMRAMPQVVGSFLAFGPLALWRTLRGDSRRD